MTQEIPQATSPSHKESLLGFLLIVLEFVLFVCYVAAGALIFLFGSGQRGIGGHINTTSKRVFSAVVATAVWLSTLICLVLCVRLNIKNRRGMALLVTFLPPPLFLLLISFAELLV